MENVQIKQLESTSNHTADSSRILTQCVEETSSGGIQQGKHFNNLMGLLHNPIPSSISQPESFTQGLLTPNTISLTVIYAGFLLSVKRHNYFSSSVIWWSQKQVGWFSWVLLLLNLKPLTASELGT